MPRFSVLRLTAGLWLALLAVLPLGAALGSMAPAVTGWVTGPDGAPAAGAVVIARKYIRNGAFTDDEPAIRTHADARGAFRFPQLATEAGDFTVLVSAYAPHTTIETETASSQRRVVRLRLQRETQLPVRVVDTRGAPVPGVRLRVDSAQIPSRPPLRYVQPAVRLYQYDEQLNSLLSPLTNAQGRVVLTHLPRGAELKLFTEDASWIQADHPMQPLEVKLAGGADTPEITVRVRRAARISGRLVTVNGESVPGWRIVSQEEPRQRVAVTGPQGEFTFAGLAEGAHSFRVWGEPNSRFARPPDFSITLREGEERRDARVVCPPGALVRLRVVRAEDGAPVPNCEISFWSPGNDIADASGVTRADGQFEQRQREGVWSINLRMPEGYAEGYDFEPADAYQRLYQKWTARDGAVHDLGEFRVHLHRLSVIRGRIYRRDGSPAAGATVYYPLEAETRRVLAWMPHVTTRADGSFETPPIDPARGERLDIYASLGDRWTAGPFKLGVNRGSDAGVDLQLTDAPLAVLRGSVVDDLGKAIPGATITVGDATGLQGDASPSMPRAGANGRFELRLWPDVEYSIFAAAEKHDWAQSSTVKLVPGRNGELPPLVLRRATSQLRIRVVDQQGRPRPRVSLSVTREDPRAYVPPFMLFATEATDERGLFIRKDIVPGTYRVEVSDPMHRTEASVEAGKLATVVLKRG